MKFTSEDLMKAMGLQVGDTVILNGKTHTFKTDKSGKLLYRNVLKMLIDVDYDILPKPKRVGDMLCKDFECDKCPLRMIQGCENVLAKYTLYECLEEIKKYNEDNDSFDQEIHDLLKARLDKEVTNE